jgi:hypothetical protein
MKYGERVKKGQIIHADVWRFRCNLNCQNKSVGIGLVVLTEWIVKGK